MWISQVECHVLGILSSVASTIISIYVTSCLNEPNVHQHVK